LIVANLVAGAGVGRVTGAVLLHLVTDVVLLEPVHALIHEAVQASPQWKGIETQEKSVTFVKTPLQSFNPSLKLTEEDIFARVGRSVELEGPATYDVVWCQWCLGHLSDKDLIRFLKQARSALRPGGVIIIKENCCEEPKPGEPVSIYDPDDSSLTR
jgi:protein N-terminal methyltransferase